MTLEWFGLPDELKRHREQIDFGLEGQDERRAAAGSGCRPRCRSASRSAIDGAGAPTTRQTGAVRDRLPLPAAVRRAGEALADSRRARSPGTRSSSAGGARGPANEELVEMIQRGRLSELARGRLSTSADRSSRTRGARRGARPGVPRQRRRHGPRPRRRGRAARRLASTSLLLARLPVHRADRGRRPRAPDPDGRHPPSRGRRVVRPLDETRHLGQGARQLRRATGVG